jgi:HSP20 family protein
MAQVPARRGQGGGMTTQRQYSLDRLRRDFDTLFSRMFSDWLTPLDPDLVMTRIPDVDVSENENEIVVRAELPGFEDSEIDVQLVNNVLTIRAEKEQRGDREYRRFYETVTLPSGINPDNVTATYRNGILELHIPRSEEAKPRRIQVQGRGAGSSQQALTGQSAPAGSATQGEQQSTAGQSASATSGRGDGSQEETERSGAGGSRRSGK